MRDLTLKRMDAAIDREIDRIVRSTDANFGIEYGEDMNRAIFLAGMQAAEKVLELHLLADDGWTATETQRKAIRATVRRLRKEAKNG